MTTIVITIIGIMLAAAAVLMTMYYGGDMLGKGEKEALAGTMLNEGMQIESAYEAYYASNGYAPTGDVIHELEQKDYLKQFPRRTSGDGYSTEWVFDSQLGVARSTIGEDTNEEAVEVCASARTKMGYTDAVRMCDDPAMERQDPCCIMRPEQI